LLESLERVRDLKSTPADYLSLSLMGFPQLFYSEENQKEKGEKMAENVKEFLGRFDEINKIISERLSASKVVEKAEDELDRILEKDPNYTSFTEAEMVFIETMRDKNTGGPDGKKRKFNSTEDMIDYCTDLLERYTHSLAKGGDIRAFTVGEAMILKEVHQKERCLEKSLNSTDDRLKYFESLIRRREHIRELSPPVQPIDDEDIEYCDDYYTEYPE